MVPRESRGTGIDERLHETPARSCSFAPVWRRRPPAEDTFAKEEVQRLRRLIEERPERYVWAVVVWAMIRQGWTPPTPSDAVADRLLTDMDVGAKSHVIDYAERTKLGPRGTRERGKLVPANATLELAPSEIQLLAMLSEGATQVEVAEALDLSLETIKTRSKRIRDKLGATTAAQSVAIAIRRGLI